MATSYPGALDALTNPLSTDTLDSATVPHATQHTNANDAIEAVQATLGVNPQGASATVVARLGTMYSSGGTDVPLLDGGTNASLTAVNGGVVYSDASAMAITSAGTSGQALVSAGAAAPTWTTLTLENLPGAWVKKSVKVATTAALGGTYANGTAGVGATLTISSTTTLDAITLANGDRILVKDQATAFQNGIYTRTSSTVLTRATDADISGDISGAIVSVDEGTANGGLIFTNFFKSTSTIGTTAMAWSKIVDVSQFGANVATFLLTPTSANLRTAVATTSTGTAGSLVFSTSPTLTTPLIANTAGTAASGLVDYNGDVFRVTTSNTTAAQAVVYAPYWVISGTATAAITTTAVNLFPSGSRTVTLEAAKAYYFRANLYCVHTFTANGTFNLVFNFSNTIQSIKYNVQYTASTGTTGWAGQLAAATTSIVTPTITATGNSVITVEGTFLTNATTGGTLALQGITPTASTISTVVQSGSMIQVMKIGAAVSGDISGTWA